MPDGSLVATWNAMLKHLDGFFEKAVEVADGEPYRDYQFTKGYKAGLEQARRLVKSLEATERPAPEELH